jgi:hypothetical protein
LQSDLSGSVTDHNGQPASWRRSHCCCCFIAEPFCFTGLWDRCVKPPSAGKFDTDLDEAPPSETIESFTIITRAANAAIAPLHDRMPVIMTPNHYGWWLKDGDGRGKSHKMALGHPLEEPLKIYPVSNLVNSPKTDDPRCIEPVAIARDFFERHWGDEGCVKTKTRFRPVSGRNMD